VRPKTPGGDTIELRSDGAASKTTHPIAALATHRQTAHRWRTPRARPVTAHAETERHEGRVLASRSRGCECGHPVVAGGGGGAQQGKPQGPGGSLGTPRGNEVGAAPTGQERPARRSPQGVLPQVQANASNPVRPQAREGREPAAHRAGRQQHAARGPPPRGLAPAGRGQVRAAAPQACAPIGGHPAQPILLSLRQCATRRALLVPSAG
jgi:hypothetical protein